MRTLLYLQIVMQIQSQLASDNASTNILKKPDHILTFIKHALETATQNADAIKPSSNRHRGSGLRMEDLRIIDDEVEDPDLGDADSDDDDDDGEPGDGEDGDDMTTTAVNLLLSILEGTTSSSYSFRITF
ncbi:hypothetical protein QCA50_005287 [Cerrena zonata]|uniref:Uncharacterized protein n=1 Tax=Cerrena zonata TaxID=2478898 RepID=A0AAW0GEF4_9APHY